MKHFHGASKVEEPPITEEACRRKLREVGIKLSRKKFCELVEQHQVPFTENALQCRGGTPNRYYEWAAIKPFFEGFIRRVN
jgi:hypothetical protein